MLDLLLLALSPVSLPVASGVLVVDAQGGGDYLQIQPAVDAAVDGDLVLVKSGSYGFFEIAHEGVSVVADAGAQVQVAGIRVRETLLDHEVVLRGLASTGVKNPTVTHVALELDTVRGPVRVEECILQGPNGYLPADLGTTANQGEPALRARRALDLSVTRSTLIGGSGAADFLCQSYTCGGGSALDFVGGSVALHDSLLQGGVGANTFDWDLSYGGAGGHGALVAEDALLPSYLYASGTSILGGPGGDGALCLDIGGAGGHGIWLDSVQRTAQVVDGVLQGAAPGCGNVAGSPGFLTGGATLEFLSGLARSLTGAAPTREGNDALLTFEGEAGDELYLLASLRPGFRFRSAVSGVFLLQNPGLTQFTFQGILPDASPFKVGYAVPDLPPGMESTVLYIQGLFRDPTTRRWLSGPTSLVVLDAAL